MRRASARSSRGRCERRSTAASHDRSARNSRARQALPGRVGAARLHADRAGNSRSSASQGRTAPANRRCSGLAVGLLDPSEGSVAIAGRGTAARRSGARRRRLRGPGRAALPRLSPSATCSISRASRTRAGTAHSRGNCSRGSSPKTRVFGALAGRASATRAGARPRQAPRAAPARRAAGRGSTPWASRDFLRLLMEGAAETGSAVVVATRVLGRHRAHLRARRPARAMAACSSTERSRICSPPTGC